MFRKTTLTAQYSFEDYRENMDEHAMLLFAKRTSGKVDFFTPGVEFRPENGDVIVSLMPPSKEFEKIQEKLEGQRKNQEEKKS